MRDGSSPSIGTKIMKMNRLQGVGMVGEHKNQAY